MEQDEMIMFPYVVHESDMAREERKQMRLCLLMILETIGVFICLKLLSTTFKNKR